MRRFSSAYFYLCALLIFAIAVVSTEDARAQTLTVLHSFTDGQDGAAPMAGLTVDRAGNFYGTTNAGGASSHGAAFRLSRKGSGWVFTPLYSFQGGNDGAYPQSRLVIGPDGSLYGTTPYGGGSSCEGGGCGTVFNLRPSAAACKAALCPWIETVLYRFTGGSDGAAPAGDLIFDLAGNLYGVTREGGDTVDCYFGCGVVYKLVPSNGSWAESVLYSFVNGNDGAYPGGGLIFDQSGNLYGTTTSDGPSGQGTVYQLTSSESGWTENTLYDFQGEYGVDATGSLVFDESGHLYGATEHDTVAMPWYPGTVYEIANSNGDWILKATTGVSFEYPSAGLTLDSAGNVYGTATGIITFNGYGSVFSFTSDLKSPGPVNYSFTGGNDGGNPVCNVIFDESGNLYGTATEGGAYSYGVVWEITP